MNANQESFSALSREVPGQSARLHERKLLFSMGGAIAFAMVGIGAGLWTRSQFLLFDGYYSLISVILSFASYSAARFMAANDWKRFPYGKQMVEPLVVAIKHAAILVVVIVASGAAVLSILSGGREVAMGGALVYAAASTVTCYVFYRRIGFCSRSQVGAGLTKAEASQWLMDTYISGAVLLAFGAALVLQRAGIMSELIPYLDPFMVLLVSGAFLKMPIRELRSATRELLDMAPEGDVVARLQRIVMQTEREFRLDESFLRVSQGSGTLWIEIDFVVSKHSRIRSIADQDAVRERVLRQVETLGFEPWLTIAFTGDRRWAI